MTAPPPPIETEIKGGVPAKSVENSDRWLTPESLNEIRELWRLADCPETQAALRQVIPIEVLERACPFSSAMRSPELNWQSAL